MAWNKRKLKPQIIEAIQKHRIVEFALKKTGLPRPTFYAWLKDDPVFAQKCEEAKLLGTDRISDLAETVIVSKLSGGDMGAAKYWLQHHHSSYIPTLRAPHPPSDLELLEAEYRRVIDEHRSMIKDFLDDRSNDVDHEDRPKDPGKVQPPSPSKP